MRLRSERRKKADLVESVSDNAPASRIVTSLYGEPLEIRLQTFTSSLRKEVEVRFRLDGVLKKKITLPMDIEPAVVSRIKILSNLKIDEQRLPQDGPSPLTLRIEIDFRVSAMPVANGEKDRYESFGQNDRYFDCGRSWRREAAAVLQESIKKSHGMTLVQVRPLR